MSASTQYAVSIQQAANDRCPPITRNAAMDVENIAFSGRNDADLSALFDMGARQDDELASQIVDLLAAAPVSCSLAVEVSRLWVTPQSASTPMCAFMPKYQSLPFLVDNISGSRAPALFLVADGASMIVASTGVPERKPMPLSARCALTSAKIACVSPCRSGTWRKLRSVVVRNTVVAQFDPGETPHD